jgi:signal transduction histidine kinase
MKIRQTYGSAVSIVVVAMIIILPLLAYLQYIWLGQISEQEYERMKSSLRATAFHCSMDFNREITDLMKSLGGNLVGSDDTVRKTVHERIFNWKATSTFPAIVTAETKISSSPSPEQTVSLMTDEESTLLLFKDLSAIGIPIKNQPHQVVMVPLNLEYISSSLLPKIIQTNFSSSTRSEYDIVIVNESGTLIYSSVDTSKHDNLQNADLVVPFLIFPSTPLSSMPPKRPARDRMRPERENPLDPFERNPLDIERRRDVPPPQERMAPGGPEWRMREHGLFELRLKHRKGSLEIAVNNNQLRNLGVSFGVLILLGASIVFLLLSTNRARRLAQQQLEFVAGISHELRTPLAVLKSAGENLADGVILEKERTRTYGELIKNEVVRLSEMVEKALAYAGIHSGKQRYELRPLPIAPVITEAIRNTKKLLPLHNVTVETDIDHSLPHVLGDTAALQSALENLIINGIKYSTEKKWIRIEAHHVNNGEGSFIEIKVMDRGIGITAAESSDIFKPFYRGRNAIDGQIQGSGLGLSITKHIIESHRGIISVKSSPFEGSVFTILLPSIIQDEETK